MKRMSDPIEQRIVAAIAEMTDPNMKTVLLLQLGVLKELGGRLDAMRADEAGLREAVLNGHSRDHDAHHTWVAKKIKEEDAAAQDSRKIRTGLVEKLLWSLLVLVASSGWWLK